MYNSRVEQLVVRPAVNGKVVGSYPTSGANDEWQPSIKVARFYSIRIMVIMSGCLLEEAGSIPAYCAKLASDQRKERGESSGRTGFKR